MRIVFVTNNWTPYSGGVVSSIRSTTEQLRKAGHEVFIITLDFLGAQHDDPDFVIRVPCPIKFMYKKNHIAVPWRPYSYLMHYIRKLSPDIIHVHHPFLLGVDGLRVARKLGIPVVFTYHTMYEHYTHYVPVPRIIIQPAVKKIVLQFCYSVDGIIAPSNSVREYLQSNKMVTSIAIIPSSLEKLFLSSSPSKKKWCPEEPFRLLVVSRFSKEKNIPFLLDAFSRLSCRRPIDRDFLLTLVGYGSEFETIQSCAYEQHGLSSEIVQFVHKPAKEELVNLYQTADLFLFASKTDTQGLVLAEAMACGLPVVALDGPGQRDIVQDGFNGFIVEDADQMVQMIALIAQNHDLHTRLQENALTTAQKFRPEILSERLLEFYVKTLEKQL